MLNHIEAKKEIRRLFYTRFKDFCLNGFTGVPAVQLKARGSATPYIPEIKWHNVERVERVDNGVHWLRFSAHNVIKQQKSMAGGRVDAVGTSYTTQGVAIVQLFFSKSAYQSQDEDFLNMVVEKCFIQYNTPGGVWFRNTMILELDPEENHFRSNVLTEYLYDSVVI